MSATSLTGGFLVFLFEKNWLEAIIKNCNTYMLQSIKAVSYHLSLNLSKVINDLNF